MLRRHDREPLCLALACHHLLRPQVRKCRRGCAGGVLECLDLRRPRRRDRELLARHHGGRGGWRPRLLLLRRRLGLRCIDLLRRHDREPLCLALACHHLLRRQDRDGPFCQCRRSLLSDPGCHERVFKRAFWLHRHDRELLGLEAALLRSVALLRFVVALLRIVVALFLGMPRRVALLPGLARRSGT